MKYSRTIMKSGFRLIQLTGIYEFERYFRPENMPWYRNLQTTEIVHEFIGSKSVHVTGERLLTCRYIEIDDTLDALIEFIQKHTSDSYGIYWDDGKLWYERISE